MAKLGKYCKAYSIEALKQYGKWTERVALPATSGESGVDEGGAKEKDLETKYLFLQEDFSVTLDIFVDENIVFQERSPEWIRFCEEELRFLPPSIGSARS